jgi:hypothetical protein
MAEHVQELMATINETADGRYYFAVRVYRTGRIVRRDETLYDDEYEAIDAYPQYEWLNAYAPAHGEVDAEVVHFAEIDRS